MALSVLRKIQEKVTQDNFVMIKGTLPTAVAEYLLNYKRDDLNVIERKYGLQVVIIGEKDMPAEGSRLDFVKTEPPPLVKEEEEIPDKKGEKPWFKKLLPI
jgi:ribonuclease E